MRRKLILEILQSSNQSVKGADLANRLKVSRQVIVQDIALMRAEGIDIMATPRGYRLNQKVKARNAERIFACQHQTLEEMLDELTIMVSYGGYVRNVIIEHSLYGEIQGNLDLATLYEVEQFVEKIRQSEIKPLSILTNGVHLHTVEAKEEAILEMIMHKLSGKRYLIDSEKNEKES